MVSRKPRNSLHHCTNATRNRTQYHQVQETANTAFRYFSCAGSLLIEKLQHFNGNVAELLLITLILFHSLVTTQFPSFPDNEVTFMYMEGLKAYTSAAKDSPNSISVGELLFIRGQPLEMVIPRKVPKLRSGGCTSRQA